MNYLIADLLLKFTYLGVNRYFPDDWGLFAWVVFILIQPILLSLAIKNMVTNPKVKIINFVVLTTSIIVLSNFVIEWFLYDRFEGISRILNLLLVLIIVPLCFNAVCKLFVVESSEYDETKSYFGFKKPVNVFGLIAALLKSPYGHCFLITGGRMFKFSKGIIKEVEYKHSKEFCLKQIKTVTLCQARDLVGRKWSLFNNCFTIFRKFK